MFMWQKTVTTYASGNKKTSSPTCLSGAVGADGEAAALLRIDSSRGTVFKNTGVSTVLTVTIYYGSQRINTSEQMKPDWNGNGSAWMKTDTVSFLLMTAGSLMEALSSPSEPTM